MLIEPAAIVEGKRVTSYAAAAAVTWMTWDTLIHLSVEVECIWRRPHSWVKWVYICIRYIPLLHGSAVLTLTGSNSFPASACKGWIVEEFIVIEALTFAVEGLLVMRLYVLYNQSKTMLSIILVAFAAEVVVMLTILGFVIPRESFTPDCLVSRSPRTFLGYWITCLVFETFLFILTLVKFFQHIHEMRRDQNILYIFIRDGTWAFAVIFVTFVLNTVTYQLIDTPVAGMGYFWVLSVMSFAGSHILLNLRRLGVPTPAETLPTIRFAHVGEDIILTERTIGTQQYSVDDVVSSDIETTLSAK